MSRHIALQVEGAALAEWALEGFPDETVLVVPVGDLLYELGVRVMECPSHVAPTEPARSPDLDEVAECVVHMMLRLVKGKEGR